MVNCAPLNKKLWQQENLFSAPHNASGLPWGIQLCRHASTFPYVERCSCSRAMQLSWQCIHVEMQLLCFVLQAPPPSSTKHLKTRYHWWAIESDGWEIIKREPCSLLPLVLKQSWIPKNEKLGPQTFYF